MIHCEMKENHFIHGCVVFNLNIPTVIGPFYIIQGVAGTTILG